MIRAIHRWAGLVTTALASVISLSGLGLAVLATRDALAAPALPAGLSLADLMRAVTAQIPMIEELRRAPSGALTAWWFADGAAHSAVIDPLSGAPLVEAGPDALLVWLTNLHRALFLEDTGRLIVAGGAAAMLALALTGLMLLKRRAGGWGGLLRALPGRGAARVHAEIGRASFVLLAFSALTGLWLTASSFDLLPDTAAMPAYPMSVSGRMGAAPETIPLFAKTPASALESLSFPTPGDAQDFYTLETATGSAYIDQGTGAVISEAATSPMTRASALLERLHSGEGTALWAGLLGLAAAGVPVLGVSGMMLWARGRRRGARAPQVALSQASLVLWVGSEGGTTRAIAEALGLALSAAGERVHIAPMSGFAPAAAAQARAHLILSATYRSGDAPASAEGFLDRLAALPAAPAAPYALLGFGDRAFPAFCGYARKVAAAAEAKGWAALVPMGAVNAGAAEEINAWLATLGAALGHDLAITAAAPAAPRTHRLALLSRRDYGEAVQAPISILRFAAPRAGLLARLTGRAPRFAPGDLLGVLPRGSEVPRFYSLASGARDGFVEIVVSRHPGGLCSGQLLALQPGDEITAFLRPNPGFQTPEGRSPLILIGAGSGVGPLAGFIRANARRRPVHLFYGQRDLRSDYLYGPEFAAWQAEGRLGALTTASSRGARPRYVQDALRDEAQEVARLIGAGARVMICGGRAMAEGVAGAMAEILEPLGLSPAQLRAEGRYVEDVY